MAQSLDALLGSNSNTSGTVATITLTTSAAVAAGGLILLETSDFGGTATSATCAGGGLTWTRISAVQSGGTWGIAQFVAPAPAGLASGTAITVTYPANYTYGYISAYSILGADLASPVQGTPVTVTAGSQNGAGDWNTGSMTPTAPCSVHGVAIHGQSSQAGTPLSGFTEANDYQDAFSNSGHQGVYQLSPTVGVGYNPGGNWATVVGNYWAVGFLINDASGPAVAYQSRPLLPRLSKFHPRLFTRLGSLLPPTVEVAGGVTYQPTGSLTAGTVAQGADVFEASETGSATTRALTSGADVAEHAETGSLTAGVTATGGDSFQPAETGTTPVGTLISGVSAYVPAGPATYNKAGSITAGTLVSGPDSFQPVEAGSLTSRALVSAADVFTAAETGATPAGTLLSGADATTHAETGIAPVGTLLSGVSVKISSGIYVKTGSLVAQTLLTGIDASSYARSGSLLTRSMLAGVAVKTGAPTEGFGGPFDSDTEHGRTGERDTGASGAGVSGSSRVRNLLGRLTSAQGGRIDSE